MWSVTTKTKEKLFTPFQQVEETQTKHEGIILGEISHIEKYKYNISTPIYGI